MKIKIKNKMKGEGDKTTVSSLSKKHGLSESDVNNLLSTGIKVELEHTKDKKVAAEIAMDHLTEDIDYYKKLKDAGLADELEKSLDRPMDAKFMQLLKDKFYKDGELKILSYGLKDIEGYPSFVDLENKDYLGIYPPDKVVFSAGGDWQHDTNMTLTRKGNKLIINEVAYDQGKQNSKNFKERLREINVFCNPELEKSKDPKKVKFEYVMKEFSDGNLKSSSGDVVTDRKQALAIAYSESGMRKSAIDWSDRLRKLFIRKHGSREDKKQLKLEQLQDERSQNVEALKDIKKQKISFSSTRNYKDIVDPSAEYDRKYRLQGKRNWNGLIIAIENKKGSYRKGKDPNGKPWKTYMNYDYGRINGTRASDDEHTDIYIGPDDTAKMVYVVHQVDPWTKKYDEDKCLVNFPSREAAIKGYLSQYNRPDFLGDVSEFTIEEFKQALRDKKGSMLYKSPILVKSESFTPPQEVRNVAKRILEAKDKHGSEVKGGTSIGWGRARQLANGEPLSMETINRMVSFFARHEGNQDTDGKTWYKDAGRVAWMLWGGDPGKRWANSIAKRNMKKSQRIVIRKR